MGLSWKELIALKIELKLSCPDLGLLTKAFKNKKNRTNKNNHHQILSLLWRKRSPRPVDARLRAGAQHGSEADP
jgi:hypothetical protein